MVTDSKALLIQARDALEVAYMHTTDRTDYRTFKAAAEALQAAIEDAARVSYLASEAVNKIAAGSDAAQEAVINNCARNLLLTQERDELRAKLAAIESQSPCATLYEDGYWL